MTFDTVIRNAKVFDGERFLAGPSDVAVEGRRIAAVGKITENSKNDIDASGLIVAPGFIDVHTHCDMAVFDFLGGESAFSDDSVRGNLCYLMQGVTTVVTGNCGLGCADTERWFDLIEKYGFGTNVLHLAPHGRIVEEVTRGRGEVLSPGALAAIMKRMEKELDAGACGISTGLEYSPGVFAETSHLQEFAKLTAKRGGIYATHIGDETGAGIIEAVREAVETGERSGAAVEISHLKISSPLRGVPAGKVLEVIEEARSSGLSVGADQYPYDFGSTFLTFLLPPEYLSGNSLKSEYRTLRGKKIVEEAARRAFRRIPEDKIIVADFAPDRSMEGHSVATIAEMKSVSADRVFAELLSSDVTPVCIFMSQSGGVLREMMKKDWIITSSDGWTQLFGAGRPHPRSYGAFPEKIRRYALDEKIISLEAALRSMTSLPAERFSIRKRGRIKEGFYADIAVIDTEKIASGSSIENPHAYAAGINYLFVNGTLCIEGGGFTGFTAGKPVRFNSQI